MDFRFSVKHKRHQKPLFQRQFVGFDLLLYGWDFSNRNQSSVNLKNPCLILSRRAKIEIKDEL